MKTSNINHVNDKEKMQDAVKDHLIETEPAKLFKLSVSKVKTWEQCKAKYRFSYIEHLPKKDHDYLIFGKFLHEILERFYKKKIAGDEEPDHIVITAAYREAFANWREKLTKDQVEEAKGMIKQYLAVRLKNKQLGVQPNVTEVEKQFQINFEDKFALIGYIDRIQIDPDGIIRVSDYKTSKDKKYLEKDFMQLLTYAYVVLRENPEVKKIRTSYIMLKHNFDEIVKEFSAETILSIENKFLQRYNEIKEEGLYRPQPSILCGYCDYREHCREGEDFLQQIGKINLRQGKQKW